MLEYITEQDTGPWGGGIWVEIFFLSCHYRDLKNNNNQLNQLVRGLRIVSGWSIL